MTTGQTLKLTEEQGENLCSAMRSALEGHKLTSEEFYEMAKLYAIFKRGDVNIFVESDT